ncbi:MAG: ABC transporter permease [Cyanobacteria bacterium P01_H01_bin.15]
MRKTTQIQFELLLSLVWRDLESRYKGSVLGNLWPLLQQLFMLLIYTYVFGIVLRAKVGLAGYTDNNPVAFGVWLFAGLVPWTAFANGLLNGATSVVNQPNLVKKVVFPLGLLPSVSVLSAFIESVFGIVVLVLMSTSFGYPLRMSALWLPLIIAPQLLFTLGFSYILSALTVYVRDIPQSLAVLLNLWFYLTPIVYSIKAVPEAFQPLVLWLNPMATVAELYRSTILLGRIDHQWEFAFLWGLALLIFVVGLGLYQRLRDSFADIL